MTTPWIRTKMRRLGLGLAMTGVLAGLGFGAYAVFGASGSPDFSITRTPAAQTVNRGQTATHIVTVKRLNGFNGSVTLKASRLPSGAIRHLAAKRRDEVERPSPRGRPRAAGHQDRVEYAHRHITPADHGDQREPLAHRNRHPGGPGGVATELQPHGITLEPISAAGGSDDLQRQGEPVRQLQRAGQAVGEWSPGRRHRLVEPERNRPSLQFGDLPSDRDCAERPGRELRPHDHRPRHHRGQVDVSIHGGDAGRPADA